MHPRSGYVGIANNTLTRVIDMSTDTYVVVIMLLLALIIVAVSLVIMVWQLNRIRRLLAWLDLRIAGKGGVR